MRLVAVTRILNEDDIVEVFIRHHAPEIAHFLFLDDGSTDRTLEILQNLKKDGFPITVFQSKSLEFDERSRNTWLYHYADQNHQPDWVIFLDTDEFIEAVEPNRSIKAHLESQRQELELIKWPLVNFAMAPDDDQGQPNVCIRLRWRHHIPHNVHKVMIRGGFGQKGREKGLYVEAGGHGARVNGSHLGVRIEEQFILAHYPTRSCWQTAFKQVVGWTKILAGGETEIRARHSIHYKPYFELMRNSPAEILLNERYTNPSVDTMKFVLRPLAYKGDKLTYTAVQDMRMKAVKVIIHHMEDLARQNGRLIDEVPGVREQLRVWMSERKLLF